MRVLALTLLVCAGLAGSARSDDSDNARGVWKSTSGASFTITDTDQEPFKLVRVNQKGLHNTYEGRWVEGLKGTQFFFMFEKGKHRATCTVNAKNHDMLREEQDDGVVQTWTRVAR